MTTPFKSGTRNDTIFSANSPYRIPYQGTNPRWLFVCSAGLLRSPTGATMASQYGINSRSCGSSLGYALIPCTTNLIRWADQIIFVDQEPYLEVVANFEGYPQLLQQIEQKKVVLAIPDNFDYMNPELQESFRNQLFYA